MRPKLKDEETEEGEIVNKCSKRTRSMEGSAIATECARMEEEENSHVKQVLKYGLENKKLRFETEAAKDQVRLLSENQEKLEHQNEKLQCFVKKQMVGRLDESLASNIAAPTVSPLSSKNKNSSPSHPLSPDTDSVDAASNVTQWHDPKTSSVTPPAPSDTTAPKNKTPAEEQAIMAIIEAHTPKPTMEERRPSQWFL